MAYEIQVSNFVHACQFLWRYQITTVKEEETQIAHQGDGMANSPNRVIGNGQKDGGNGTLSCTLVLLITISSVSTANLTYANPT
jgi:hypothetical protein